MKRGIVVLQAYIVTLCLFASCGFIPKVHYIPSANNAIQRTPPEAIEILKSPPDKRPYIELGTVIADPKRAGFETAVNKMKTKASKIGGDAIYGIARTSDKQYVGMSGITANTSQLQGGSFAQTYQTNELKATVIRWKD